MYKIKYFLLIFLLITSCKKKQVVEKITDTKVSLNFIGKVLLQESEGSYIGSCDKIRFDEKEWIYYGDHNANQVIVFDPNGRQVRRIGNNGEETTEIKELSGFDVRRGKVAILDGASLQISIYDTLGNFIRQFNIGIEGDSYPWGNNLQINSDQKILVTEGIMLADHKWPEYYESTWLVTEYDSLGRMLKHYA